MSISPWVVFFLTGAVVVVAASKLAQYGDVIAVRTRLGGLFVGTIFLAAATSLPEFVASISAFQSEAPNLAAGNLFGSNMVNVLFLAIIDMVNYRVPLMRRTAINHTLTAVLASLLMLLAVIFILSDIEARFSWLGLDSLVLIIVYFAGVWLIQNERKSPASIVPPAADDVTFPTLRRGLAGFGLSAALLIFVVPLMVDASADIAESTGLGNSFIGISLLSIVTSLPELLAALAAVRIGAFDLAVGNLFGSSVFNMLALGIADIFYTEGRFLGAIDPIFVLVGLLALLLTNMALMATLARVERRFLFIEVDAALIILVYLAGMYVLFLRGVA